MREIDKFIESNDDLKHAVKAYDQLKAAEITWQNPEFDLLDEANPYREILSELYKVIAQRCLEEYESQFGKHKGYLCLLYTSDAADE